MVCVSCYRPSLSKIRDTIKIMIAETTANITAQTKADKRIDSRAFRKSDMPVFVMISVF